MTQGIDTAGAGSGAACPAQGDRRIVAGNGRPVQVRTSNAWKFDAATRQRFLDTLAATCNVREGARVAGVSLGTAYRVRRLDARFAAAWKQALEIGYERLELATLGYLLERMDVDAIDPDAAPDGVVDLARRIEARGVTAPEMQLAMAMLARRHGVVDRAPQKGARLATAAETDAMIGRKLDALARRDRKPA